MLEKLVKLEFEFVVYPVSFFQVSPETKRDCFNILVSVLFGKRLFETESAHTRICGLLWPRRAIRFDPRCFSFRGRFVAVSYTQAETLLNESGEESILFVSTRFSRRYLVMRQRARLLLPVLLVSAKSRLSALDLV